MNIEITDELAIELIDAYDTSNDSGEVDDLKRLRDLVGTLLLYIPDPRGAQSPARPIVESPVERIVLKPRAKLTPNQRQIYNDIVRMSGRLRGTERWVEARYVGSKNTCDRLAAKGWIDINVTHGPRGGEQRWYRPTEAPA